MLRDEGDQWPQWTSAVPRCDARRPAGRERRRVADKIDLDRPLACTIRDLGVAFHGQLTGGRLLDLTDGDNPSAKIRLTASQRRPGRARQRRTRLRQARGHPGASGIRANPFDLLKLRKLL